jgi:hypothetical protein
MGGAVAARCCDQGKSFYEECPDSPATKAYIKILDGTPVSLEYEFVVGLTLQCRGCCILCSSQKYMKEQPNLSFPTSSIRMLTAALICQHLPSASSVMLVQLLFFLGIQCRMQTPLYPPMTLTAPLRSGTHYSHNHESHPSGRP